MRDDFHVGVEMLLHCVSDQPSLDEDHDDKLQVWIVSRAVLCM